MLGMTVVACTPPASDRRVTTTDTPSNPAETSLLAGANHLDWSPCGAGLQCSTLIVPKDDEAPSAGSITLFLKRRPASSPDQRIGSLLVNPGGPGVPGTDLVDHAVGAFDHRLLERFDIVGWDPRGTGQSGQIVCADDLDPYFALDPVTSTDAGRAALAEAAERFAHACEQRNGDLLPYVSTVATARDMERIRRALGEDRISYFGASYGSELGALWLTMFPKTVRAAVLDGVVDPNADAASTTRYEASGLEGALDAMLARCADDPSCPIYESGHPDQVFDRVMTSLETAPVPVAEAPQRPAINRGMAALGITGALYDETRWPSALSALASLERGNAKPMLDLYDSFLTLDGRFPHLYDALLAVSCLDDPGPTDAAGLAELQRQALAAAPRMGRSAVGVPFCAHWPVRGKPFPKVTGHGARPVLVIATTGDPILPAGAPAAASLAGSLEHAVLVTATANRHTGYRTSTCVDGAVDAYLIELTVPSQAIMCGSG